jgi:2-keto-4-pentenoate hydratase/2-oxohepta-3-ene-1,7-dioic acid hydratase in catechol pathway
VALAPWSLNDGDIIMTGTPKAVGVINPQHRFSAKIPTPEGTLVSEEWIAE